MAGSPLRFAVAHILRSCLILLIFLVLPFGVSARPTEPENEALARGQRAFAICGTCHTLSPDARHAIGPNLHGILGRDVASADGFSYSEALRAKDGVWDEDALNRYIARPKLAAPGNEMRFAGITSPHARRDLITWLKSNPLRYSTPALSLDATPVDYSLERGIELARTCLVCHNASMDMGHKIGPNLWGVVGRPIASAPGFDYSERLRRRSGGVWTPETLNAFFVERRAFGPGSHMAFRSLTRLEDRAALIAWLDALDDNRPIPAR